MKKYLLVLLIAISAVSCSKKEDAIYFEPNVYSLQFDARTGLLKYLNINTNTTEWNYEIIYQTAETDWCKVEKTSSSELKITVTTNTDEFQGRNAIIQFYVNGKQQYQSVSVYQSEFQYTADEQRLITAQKILNNKYSYVDLDIDFESKYYESNSTFPTYKGVFYYNKDGLNLSIPVILSPRYFQISSSGECYDYVSVSPISLQIKILTAAGNVYTGFNSNLINFEMVYHYQGDFDITIFGYDDNNQYINIKLTN